MGVQAISWVCTVEQLVRGHVADVWQRTPGVETDEATARGIYDKAVAEGLPEHLRHPQLTRVTREVIDEAPPDNA